MCSLIGMVADGEGMAEEALRGDKLGLELLNAYLFVLWDNGKKRGRDGCGWWANVAERVDARMPRYAVKHLTGPLALVGNYRAEPTTEYVKDKQQFDQQPYGAGDWVIVHNGTISNDKELRDYTYPSKIDSAAILELLCKPHIESIEKHFESVIRKLEGSYAIIAVNLTRPDTLFVACNYRPIWYTKLPFCYVLASSRHHFPDHEISTVYPPQMLEPYCIAKFTPDNITKSYGNRVAVKQKSLVVCSGGLDSVVAATMTKNKGVDVTLLHFTYGSRCQEKEIEAVHAVGKYLEVPVVIKNLPVYCETDSRLLQTDSSIAGGEDGAEFAHEWVPARNLIFLSVAAAYAEANGFTELVLGNNMEEAGAYPDNEPEFIDRFNDLLPFATGPNKLLKVEMPLGNYVKHEIVSIGLKQGAPLHLTWSCYRSEELHCGTCGPCYMRRKAFEINNAADPITYQEN
jgi:7-cyano-7-deazaguanine synthase